jgi:hypothetical protein
LVWFYLHSSHVAPDGRSAVVHDLPLIHSLVLVAVDRAGVTMPAAAVTVPVIADLSLILDLAHTILPGSADVIGQLHKLKDILLFTG